MSQNLVLDLDVTTKQPTDAQIGALEIFLKRADKYFLDLCLNAPTKAYTGRGFHLLFAYPEIRVAGHPDITMRLKRFRSDFRDAFRHELAELEAKLDSTTDLRRVVRIYGTAKPTVGIISRFYGGERSEDEHLRAYLLGLQLSESHWNFLLQDAAELPPWLERLLEQDSTTRELWLGTGKAHGFDTSRSGYDYSLILHLLRLGYRNLDELATILMLRPEGSVQKSGKGEPYVRLTIANAVTPGERLIKS